MNDTISKNIRKYRELKGYSQEYMAHELHINQASYAKIENSSTKLSVERLFEISKLLETDVSELLDLKKQTIYNQDLKEYSVGHQEVQNLYQDNKEITAKLIDSYEARLREKDDHIAFLQAMLPENR